MHRNVLLWTIGFVYYALAGYTLYIFESGLLVTSLILFGVPAYVLARYSSAPSFVLSAVVMFGVGLSVLLEGIAHIYGIWYTIGIDELRLFGLIPIEVVVASILQTLFLALLYELIFDDGEYSLSHMSTRLVSLGVFSFSAVLLIALHVYLVQGIFFAHSYIWIIGILIASTLALLGVNRSLTIAFFDKLSAFTFVACIPLCIGLILSVTNTHKVFAFTNDYFYTFTLLGNQVPLEEVLMLLFLPLFIATFYELYLDDGEVK